MNRAPLGPWGRRCCTYCGTVIPRSSFHREGWSTVHKKCYVDSDYGFTRYYRPNGVLLPDREIFGPRREWRSEELAPLEGTIQGFFARLGLPGPPCETDQER